MKLLRRLQRDDRHITSLRMVIIALLLVNFLLWLGWHHEPDDLTIHIPPDLSSGVTMKANDVPAPSLYSFAFYIWQVLGNWQQNGAVDFEKNIQNLTPYLSSSFKSELIEQMVQLQAKGELQDRTRVIQGEIGAAYKSANVIPLGNNAWEVDVRVRVTERIGNTILLDALISYPLRVVRYDVNRQNNAWGLVIDGFVSEPQRIQTYI